MHVTKKTLHLISFPNHTLFYNTSTVYFAYMNFQQEAGSRISGARKNIIEWLIFNVEKCFQKIIDKKTGAMTRSKSLFWQKNKLFICRVRKFIFLPLFLHYFSSLWEVEENGKVFKWTAPQMRHSVKNRIFFFAWRKQFSSIVEKLPIQLKIAFNYCRKKCQLSIESREKNFALYIVC